MLKKLLAVIIALMIMILPAFALTAREDILVEDGYAITNDLEVEFGNDYYAYADVALYLCAFEELPPNYFTKAEARKYGWKSGDDLWDTSYGMCIGGDHFGNYEGALPDAEGRNWYECDVNYEGGHRGADRLIFSNDGLIYYTCDHYTTFEQLYDGWYDENGLYNAEEEENAA